MKLLSQVFALVTILASCREEEVLKFPDLADGTYHLEIFDIQGRKVLTREGNAIGLGSYSQVVIEDPEFASQAEEDSLDTFAALWLFTEKTHASTWDENFIWNVDAESAGAIFIQRYYGGLSDWQYESVLGEIRIFESTDNVLKGYFEITMRVRQSDENNPGIVWTSNPKWGDQIVVKGFFSSQGW